MENNYKESINQVKSSLEIYLQFLNLYRKPRPPEVKRLIERIINEEQSITVRIERISEIDKKLTSSEKNTELLKEEVRKKKAKATSEEKKHSHKPILQNNIFNYILFERGKLVSFGTRTQTISFKMLGIKKELSATAIVFWRQNYSDIRDFLYKQINYALLHGWKNLEPESYNIIVTFNHFLINFIKEGELLDRNKTPSHNLKVIESFVEPYLALSYNPKYSETLKESLYEILYASEDYKPTIKASMRILEEVVNSEKRTLGFFNIILANYALHFNRFVKHSNLLQYYNTKEINDIHYDFNQKTLGEIKNYMSKINEEIAVIEDELFYLKFIDGELNSSSPLDNKWVSYFNQLSLFENIKSSNQKTDINKNDNLNSNPFEFIFQDVLKSICLATKGFLTYYSFILKDDIKISDNKFFKKVTIFKPILFRKELLELEDVIKDYEFMKTSGDVFSIRSETYQIFISQGKVDLEKEEKICRMIEKQINCYNEIGDKIANILLKHYNTSKATKDELLEKYKTQNEPISDIDDDNRLIPYAFENIVHHSYLLENEKVLDVLNQIAFFSLNLVYIFQKRELVVRFLERDSLLSKMERNLKLKSKVEND